MWSVGEQALYWVDIDGRAIHRFDPETGRDERRTTVGRPGSIALTTTPGLLLVASEHELGWFTWDDGGYERWVELEPAATGNRLNDGRCDVAGRFWVGSMWQSPADEQFTGLLHRVEPDGDAATLRREIGVSNGLAFGPGGDVMYFADTLRHTVWAYDYDSATGTPSNERVFTDWAGLPGGPDGACIDTEGCYWTACVHGGAVARLTPEGATDRIIELPATRPTMPAFGGPELATLYVTSIGGGGSRRPDEPQQLDGGLFAIDCGVSGLREPAFAGSRG